MMLETAWVVAQTEALRENTVVPSTVNEVAGTNLFAGGCLEPYSLPVDFQFGQFGLLTGDGAIVNSNVVEISVYVLPKPMVLIPSAGSELQTFCPIVNLAGTMKDVAEVAFNPR